MNRLPDSLRQAMRWLILTPLLMLVTQSVIVASACNTSALAAATASCTAQHGVNDTTASSSTSCWKAACWTSAALALEDGCINEIRPVAIGTLQSNCSSSISVSYGVTFESCSATDAVSGSNQTQFTDLVDVFRTTCTVDMNSLSKVSQCLSALPCRQDSSVFQSLCSSWCVAQSMTCFLSYACANNRFTAFSELGFGSNSGCVHLLPLDWITCKTSSTISTNALEWCNAAISRLPQPESETFVSHYRLLFAIGGGCLGFIALAALVTVLVLRWKAVIRKFGCGDQSQMETHDNLQQQQVARRQRGQGESSKLTASPERTRYDQKKRTASDTMGSKQSERVATRHNNHDDDEMESHVFVFDHHEEDEYTDPPTIVDRRPNALQHLTWSTSNGWSRMATSLDVTPQKPNQNGTSAPTSGDIANTYSKDASLFQMDDEEHYYEEAHQPPSDNASGSSSVAPYDDPSYACVRLPVYEGSRARLNSGAGGRSQTMSLGELEFQFTSDPSNSRHRSSNSDDVMPIDPAELLETSSHAGFDSTPVSDVDGADSSRMVFEQESILSEGFGQSMREDAIAAGSTLARKDIIASILQGLFQRGRLLGRGTTGTVYQMLLSHPSGALCVAMKEIDVQKSSREELSRVIARYNFLSRLNHRYLAEIYVVRYDPSSLSLNVWMEYVGGGTLREFAKRFKPYPETNQDAWQQNNGGFSASDNFDVNLYTTVPVRSTPSVTATPTSGARRPPLAPQRRGGNLSNNGSFSRSSCKGGIIDDFPERHAVMYATQLLSVVSYLHRKGVIHRDVKGGNILLTVDGQHIKLVDLDCCYMVPELARGGGGAGGSGDKSSPWSVLQNSSPPSVAGSPLWMPPEILASKSTPSPATDIWSVGITMAEILQGGHVPWPSFESPFAAIVYITQQHPPSLRRTTVSDACIDFLTKCWAQDPTRRPSAMELRSHSWLQRSRPSSFRRMPVSRDGTVTPKSTNLSSARSSQSGMGHDEDDVSGLEMCVVGAPSSAIPVRSKFDHEALEKEMKQLEEELSRF